MIKCGPNYGSVLLIGLMGWSIEWHVDICDLAICYKHRLFTNIRHKAKRLSFIKLLPNIFTTIGLCTGLTGIRFALDSDWQNAALCVLVAACFDMIDGLSARLLRAFSRFGAELDSLADAISFGVAPSIISFLWIKDSLPVHNNSEILGWFWIPFLFYTMCCAFRLARFNVMTQEKQNDNIIKKGYFIGVPSPAGAGLVLLPLSFNFICNRFDLGFQILDYSYLLLLWVGLISVLLISQIPTFSFRNIRLSVSSGKALFVLIIVCLFVAIFIKEMWLCLFSVGIFYLLSVPISFFMHRKDIKNLN